MSTPTRVNPGDLITANLMNDILTRLKVVEDKLAAPGTTTGVVRISATTPLGTAGEPIRVNQTLQILGENFGYFAGQASVTFERSAGNVVIQNNQMLTGSSDTRLLMTVPAFSALSQAGETVMMRVRNGTTEDVRSVFVRPVVITLQGDLFVDWRTNTSPNPNPNPLQSSGANPQSASFNYTLRTATNLAATFDLSATITNATVAVPPALESSIQFLDESGNQIQNRQLQLGANDSRNIVVRIPQVPATFASQSFRLNVSAASGGVTGGDARTFTVGVAVTPPDAAIEATQTGNLLSDAAGNNTSPTNGSFDGTTIGLRPGNRMMLIFNITKLDTIGTYDVTIEQKSGTTGWAPELVTTITPIVVQTELDRTQPRLAQFRVTGAAASVNGSVLFKIKRRGAPSDFSKEYGVQKLP
jgi:hypothetical protein